MSQFQVLFSGEISDGVQEEHVMKNLARSLALDERKVGQLFSGRTVVIKSQMSRNEAFALQEQFSEMGAIMRVKDLDVVSRVSNKLDKSAPDQTLKDITAAHQECPRCGHLQLESEFCTRCGVDVAAATQQKRKEDLLIEKKIRDMNLSRQRDAEPKPRIVEVENLDLDSEAEPGFGRITGWIRSLRNR